MVIGFHGCTGDEIVVVGLRWSCGLLIPNSGTMFGVGIVVMVSMWRSGTRSLALLGSGVNVKKVFEAGEIGVQSCCG